MIILDGSIGEGGGQIVRTSLALSLFLQKPFHLKNIRAKRKLPGLRRQHLIAVMAATKIGNARAKGADLGSQELVFEPAECRCGEFEFDIGSAGSTTLVLQTILPVLMIAKGPSHIIIKGGTHNPLAPTFDFLDTVFFPILQKMGVKINARMERAGFYPRGGGYISIQIQPADHLKTIQIEKRGRILNQEVTAVVAGLPLHIALREAETIKEALELKAHSVHTQEYPPDWGPGNFVNIKIVCEGITELFTGIGQRGIKAEEVAMKTVREVRRYLASSAPVHTYLADQLLLPLVLAKGGTFNTLSPSLHTRTNINVIKKFLTLPLSMKEIGNDVWHIAVT